MSPSDFGSEPENVVSLPSAGSPEDDAALAKIESYWQKVRQGRLVPSRSEIDPRGMEGVLAHAFILERVSTGLARLRIAGSHMTELLGMEARGMPLSAIFAHPSREALAEAMEPVFDEPAIARFRLTSTSGFGRPALQGGMVLLPLRSDLGDITRVLGAVSLKGSVGRTPRRLEIAGQSHRSLVGYAARPGETTGLSGRFAAPTPRHPKTPRPTASEPPKGRQTGHLRLVVVNDT